MSRNIDEAVDFLYINGKKYAEAKAQRVYLEEFRKSQKAMMMKKAIADGTAKTSASAEMEAYSSAEYIQTLNGIKLAIEQEETIRWELVAAQARIEVFRTQSANDRFVEKVTL